MSGLFDPVRIGTLELENRIVRSATFEGMADLNGFPGSDYLQMYSELAAGGAGAIITGFVYVSRQGRAMQPGQAGMDSPEKAASFLPVTQAVHDRGGRIFLQIAHTGRQTVSRVTGEPVVGPSEKRSLYFREKPVALSTEQIKGIVNSFADSAFYAMQAGFDGIQLHAAHGYLIHQFLHPGINNRRDRYGPDPRTGTGTLFFEEIIKAVREKCGDFPLLVKVSGADDLWPRFRKRHFESLITFLDRMAVDGIEVSYGTMDHALNIFRGDVPVQSVLSHNPFLSAGQGFKRLFFEKALIPCLKLRLRPFQPYYNLKYAFLARKLTRIPVISVGGFRSRIHMEAAVENGYADIVSMCRPFIAEPQFALRIRADNNAESICTSCNRCAVMCDSDNQTRCYRRRE